ncbi:MAG: glutamate synthase, partial [Elusimicrobia bacterium]|nr:glutamate synthase [Elusimicrobiota bacterium]
MRNGVQEIIESRKVLVEGLSSVTKKTEEEGGCGVLGAAANFPVEGKHLLPPLTQMRNRGNGKGGGVALVGLSPEQWGVDQKLLSEDYILQIAYLDPSVRRGVEEEFIHPIFEIHTSQTLSPVGEYRSLGLEVPAPEVQIYFVRPKEAVIREFSLKNGFRKLDADQVADELMYQNSFRLHKKYYASLGEKKALVLSHGKNMLNFKIVGYGEQVISVYGLEKTKAHVWIGHHRYPTKGNVWHPGGAHPFIGVNEALVHNGDFANYASICDSLAQRNIYPLFLTDTEVSVLLFDLLRRVYGYPLEYVMEALAPTTDRDFQMLPEEKKRIYKIIQQTHIHSSPDGPWFFILASHERKHGVYELIGITDTSMLRPQVFALQEGKVKVGAIASEKQAIDAFFRSLYEDRKVPCPVADRYWNARGGSYTDG